MTLEEIMRPRYKVIADYPHSLFRKGMILEQHFQSPLTLVFWGIGNESVLNPAINMAEAEKFPDIFRKLEWYQDRYFGTLEKHVKYLKHVGKLAIKSNGKMYKVKDFTAIVGYMSGNRDSFIPEGKVEMAESYDLDYYVPATEEEFLDYLERKINARQ